MALASAKRFNRYENVGELCQWNVPDMLANTPELLEAT